MGSASRPRSSGVSSPPVTTSKVPRSASCRTPPSSSRRAGAARCGDDGTLVLERRRDERAARSGHAPGPERRAAGDLRGDGSRARARCPLREHQGAPRRLHRALRPPRRDGHAGGAHPSPPRRDAGSGRRRQGRAAGTGATPGSSTTPTGAARTCRTSRWSRRSSSSGHHVGFAASRAHHADVGGSTPGSMPADSTTLDDEGVVIPPTLLVRGGELDRRLLESLTGRMRSPRQREADLRAQLAANRLAGLRLEEIAAPPRPRPLERAMAAFARLRGAANARVHRGVPGRHLSGARRARGRCRAGSSDLKIAVTRSRSRRGARGRLHGHRSRRRPATSTARCPSPSPPCTSCCASLTDPDIPASAGAYRPVRVSAPAGCLVNAQPPAAVVGGNVETSSRIADVLMLAFGQAIEVPALGQGTMNNVTLGNESFTYYETIGGGQGACPRRRRALGGARRDEQHAQHAGRGDRARVPAARDASTRCAAARAATGASRR